MCFSDIAVRLSLCRSVITTLPVSEPAPLRVFSSRNRSASTAARQREGAADDRLELAFLDPADDVVGAAALLLGRSR